MRRTKKLRAQIAKQSLPSLQVFRSAEHMYAQISLQGKVLAAASTVQSAVKQELKNTGNIHAAAKVGKAIAMAAKTLNIQKVVFDRRGYAYHGRVKALADHAREGGLQF